MVRSSTQQQRSNFIYQHWDAPALNIPARSRLYSLPPIGIGTAGVESLTGYVARLAEAHCVSPHTLLAEEILGIRRLKKRPLSLYHTSFLGFSSNHMNGVGTTANLTVSSLEQLTFSSEIRYTTLLTWANILSPSRLLRRKRAWCALCYGEWWIKGQQIYEPLLWSFDAVSICPWHHEPLSEICPHCNNLLPHLTSTSHPGYCSRCKRWLGTIPNKATHGEDASTLLSPEPTVAISAVDLIGKLLTHASSLESPPSHQGFIAKLTKCIDETADGSINAFSHSVGIWSGTVRRLLAGATRPRLEVLCQICMCLQISLLDLMSSVDDRDMLEKRRVILRIGTPMPQDQVPWDEVEGRLRAALQESPPPSMEEVARRMGYYQPRIRYNFPELCAQIVARYREQLKSKHPHPLKVRRVFRVALTEFPPPSLQSVLRRLGCKDTGYYYYHNYRELCLAVAERFKSYRNKPFDKDTDRARLEAALFEDPPPSFSEMARRLDHKRDFLRRKFSELSQAIVSRHLYYRSASNNEKAERLRSEIKTAVQCLIAAGLNVSEAKVKAQVRKRLPNTGRDSLFKQALREIKAELGLDQ